MVVPLKAKAPPRVDNVVYGFFICTIGYVALIAALFYFDGYGGVTSTRALLFEGLIIFLGLSIYPLYFYVNFNWRDYRDSLVREEVLRVSEAGRPPLNRDELNSFTVEASSRAKNLSRIALFVSIAGFIVVFVMTNICVAQKYISRDAETAGQASYNDVYNGVVAQSHKNLYLNYHQKLLDPVVYSSSGRDGYLPLAWQERDGMRQSNGGGTKRSSSPKMASPPEKMLNKSGPGVIPLIVGGLLFLIYGFCFSKMSRPPSGKFPNLEKIITPLVGAGLVGLGMGQQAEAAHNHEQFEFIERQFSSFGKVIAAPNGWMPVDPTAGEKEADAATERQKLDAFLDSANGTLANMATYMKLQSNVKDSGPQIIPLTLAIKGENIPFPDRRRPLLDAKTAERVEAAIRNTEIQAKATKEMIDTAIYTKSDVAAHGEVLCQSLSRKINAVNLEIEKNQSERAPGIFHRSLNIYRWATGQRITDDFRARARDTERLYGLRTIFITELARTCESSTVQAEQATPAVDAVLPPDR